MDALAWCQWDDGHHRRRGDGGTSLRWGWPVIAKDACRHYRQVNRFGDLVSAPNRADFDRVLVVFAVCGA